MDLERPPDLDRYVAALRRRFGSDLVSVVLFGSWARGEARAESDIDLLVVARGLPRSRLDRSGLLMRTANEVGRALADRISPVSLTPEEAAHTRPFYLGMLSGHVLLVDEGGFFAEILQRLRQRLAELGSRRYIDEDGNEYWDLKPDWKPGDVVEL
jgi:predicted nucleotidyltransferase